MKLLSENNTIIYLFVHSYERCLSKGIEFCWNFGPLGNNCLFLREAGSQQNVKKAKAFSAFLGNDKERETVEFLADTV